MNAIVTIFESKKDSATENKGEGRILFQHTYPMLPTVKPDGEIHKTNEKKNLQTLESIQKYFQEKFDVKKNFLEVQFDIESELEEIKNS